MSESLLESTSGSSSRPKMDKRLSTTLKLLRCFIFLVVMLCIFYEQAAHSREQWQIDRPDPPPTGYQNNHTQIGMPGSFGTPNGLGQSNQIGNHAFINQILASRLACGSVLTGVVDTDLSSKKSKTGDIFAVLLQDGFVNNGQEIIPPGSKIIGTVVNAASAKQVKIGMPGQLIVGLQSLVFPDGRTTKFYGFLDQNPAHELSDEPSQRYSGFNLGDYGKQVKGMFGSFAGGIGWVHNSRMRGKEFEIEAGRRVAVKVNRTMDLSSMTPALGPGVVPGMVGGAQPGMNAMGSNGGYQQAQVPGLVQPPAFAQGQNYYSGRRPVAVPGLVGSDPQAPNKYTKPTQYNSNQTNSQPSFAPQNNMPVHAIGQGQTSIPFGGSSSQANQPVSQGPNMLFQHSSQDPLRSMPDPF